jgi:hypothetical protein
MAEGLLGAPTGAIGWNVYVSTTAADLTKQNSQPLAIGATWQIPTSGIIEGPFAIGGQQPDYQIQLSRLLQRG